MDITKTLYTQVADSDQPFPYCQVHFWKQKSQMDFIWKGKDISTTEMREGQYLSLEVMNGQHFQFMLIDLAEFNCNWVSELEWIKEMWFPELSKTGVKKVGVVMPENLFSQIATEQFAASFKSVFPEVQLSLFTSRIKAGLWLV
ncbi:hypothetical protein V6R21_12520 [Limibacter armeniacum]|uniref:hypothetical protein n=1 Tax=Limibacter armeniacum TaxID=466084 RepID=UPI002FE61759